MCVGGIDVNLYMFSLKGKRGHHISLDFGLCSEVVRPRTLQFDEPPCEQD
jgi:hypothetical protein